ncbi:type II toxin-antitoxin system RatA family toxin [Abyssibius alkaniclasticus]|uniref:type II toxin-antitoxin system RatA family toxin n=1 Tax=Abyssibius alkaniclasticus TaxID=2881234 RepID=UPI002364842F|nr:type II toxin-antitoxin system RatA family toxin [Abyssibius alkaniclasticus]UPH70645.1 type II toxin-antitoxin system RatA family toxin [Abyssibius alkaniclasticus]
MTTHSETRKMPYSAAQMYALVADVARYPEFLPWCAGARIRATTRIDAIVVMEADLVISFKLFREKFGSRVTLDEAGQKILVEYLDGPFKYLRNSWAFRDVEGGCEIDFFVDFEFKSRVLQTLIGVVFTEAMHRIVRAFEARARALYGDG